MSTFERFNNRILSITTAEPGWQVTVRHRSILGKETRIDEEHVYPVVTWALVEVADQDGSTYTRVEPVFCADSPLMNSTEYRRMHSDVTPGPGEPKLIISIELQRP